MWCDNVNFNEDYSFKSSPESCSDNSFCTDAMENASDEDFMTQLSSDLDIPLLLNPGEDEMALLNSFLDKTPDEILSDITSAPDYIMNDSLDFKDTEFLNEIPHPVKNNVEILDGFRKHTKSDNSLKPSIARHNDKKSITYFEYLNGALDPPPNQDYFDIKLEDNSDESCSSRNSLEPSTPPPIVPNKKLSAPIFFVPNILPKRKIVNGVEPATIQVVPQSSKSTKVPIKRVPIKPKTPYTVPVKNIVVIKNIKSEFPGINIKETNNASSNLSSNIMVLDSIHLNGFNTLTRSMNVNKPVNISSLSVNQGSNVGVDPRILKRQERKIKNRESASTSRKKKKDYLNALEEQVKDLTAENQRLLVENTSLRERLSFHEGGKKLSFNISPQKGAKPALVLCAFLLVIGLNINLSSSPFSTKLNKIEPASSDYPKLPDHYGRNLLWARGDLQEEKLNNSTYFSPFTMCPASINESESARLLLELEKWIGKPEPIKTVTTPRKSSQQQPKARRKKMRLDLSLAQIRKQEQYGPENEVKNEIQVFSPNADQVYSEFFEAINRQEDTFYVVSFSEQHMLLPALYHNNTRRPKMSLLMPSLFPNETSTQTYIPLMQIDCEVLDTKLVNVKYGSIPRPYRHYGNSSKENDASKRSSSRKYDSKKAYKPYFLSKNVLKAVDFN